MLQIASGMYFRPGVERYETLHRATVYSNCFRIGEAPVVLPFATLRFSTGFAPFAPATVEVWDRLEAERPDGVPEFLKATSGQDLVNDVAAVLAFALNTTWSTDRDRVRRLVPAALSEPLRGGPSSQLRRTFDSQVLVTDEDLADVAAFSTRLLALRRADYEKAIRAIRRVVDATVLIADDVSLAYTLFVAALESLAATTTASPTRWDVFDGSKRALIDAALHDLSDEQAQRVRSAVLAADALTLGRKFRAFIHDHLDPSFFRVEAAGAQWPISAPALPHALDFAYQVRSRQVHALELLAPEVWAVADRADTIRVEGRWVLSLEGLNRLCRHVIRRYVERAPTGLDTTFNYRQALPGIVRMQLAPQYWIWQSEGLRAEDVPAVLEGFLDVLVPTLRGDDDAALVNMTAVLERIEAWLPGEASAAKRAPLVALYALWHRYLVVEQHRPRKQALLNRFGPDLDVPSPAAFAVALLLDGDVRWTTHELVELAAARADQLRRGKGHPLPVRFDAALQLILARRLWQQDRTEEALAAVGRAVETVPGDAKLLAFEEQAAADPANAAGLGTLDVRGFLLDAADTAGELAVDDETATQAGLADGAGQDMPEATAPPAV